MSDGFATPYGEAALKNEAAKVSAAPMGEQEATLNKAAFASGQLIASGDLSEGMARNALVDAGLQMTCDPARYPWTHEVVAAKVAHGLADGGTKPRSEPARAPVTPSQEAPEATCQLSSICVLDLLKRDIKPRELILSPWLRERDLSMIHAFRGIGKTYLSLSVALAVASGGDLMKWTAPRPRKVLLVDGEMPLGALQERSRDLISANGWDCKPGAFQIISSDAQDGYIPNLSNAKGQEAIAGHLDGVDLLVIDNLSTLAYGGTENDADSWSAMQAWLIELRKAGKAVLIVHHSGKSGQQRGTSRREDALNVVLGLKRPAEYSETEGAKFEIHFEKARDVCGDDVRTMEAQLHSGDGSAMWTWSNVEDLRDNRIAELLSQGLSQREIADELKISKSTVNRVLKRSEKQ
jgi:putative DNA primase/helicase